jgi:hypothetical protein
LPGAISGVLALEQKIDELLGAQILEVGLHFDAETNAPLRRGF